METIEATFRVVTPMFMSGADQGQAELRLPSIKGALRFWWRALAWERLNGNLAAIRKEENELFGSTDTGQAGVLMKLELLGEPPKVIEVGAILKDNSRVVGEGSRYLGYGVMEAFGSSKKGTEAGQLIRPCLQAPFEFKLSLLLKPQIEKHKDELVRSLKTLGLFGGLGSKSRKGYGSLCLKNLEYKKGKSVETLWKEPATPKEVRDAISELGLPQSTDEPEITAFSKSSRILLLESQKNESPLSLQNRIGREQVFYRSWGNKRPNDAEHKVFGAKAEQNFKPDHDLMKQVARGSSANNYPERVAFGLPHNYGKNKNEHVEPSNEKLYTRRASPLFIHIHQLKNSDLVAIITFLPARFLPENETIRVGRNHLKPDMNTLWQPITDFLTRLEGKYQTPLKLKRHESFSYVEVIK